MGGEHPKIYYHHLTKEARWLGMALSQIGWFLSESPLHLGGWLHGLSGFLAEDQNHGTRWDQMDSDGI